MSRSEGSRIELARIETVKDRIRDAGLRCTAARLAVLNHLGSALGPRTHAEVSEALANLGFDRATIYRNLTELTEKKLVTRVELGDHVWRFELRRPGGHGTASEDHPHFLCTTCGEISCLDDVRVAITPKPRRRTNGAAPRGSRASRIHSVTEVLLKGRCDTCG
jgi:Fur family ferric uptake transcriptional regulator